MERVTFELPDAVGLTTVEGVSDYWVELRPGVPSIAYIDTANDLAIGDLRGAVLEYDYDGNMLLSNCETAWATSDTTNVTMTNDSSVYKVGTKSVKAAFASGASAGAMISKDFTVAKNLTKYTRITFWARGSVASSAGDYQFAFDDTAACASPVLLLDFPALVQDTWQFVSLTITDPSVLSAVLSIGVKYKTDLGAANLYIDDVRILTPLGHQVEQLVVDDYIPNTGFFALSAAIAEDEQKINRKITLYYDSFATSPVCPVS